MRNQSRLLLLAAALSPFSGTVQAQLIDVDFNTNSSPANSGGPAVGPTMSGAAILGATGDQWLCFGELMRKFLLSLLLIARTPAPPILAMPSPLLMR